MTKREYIESHPRSYLARALVCNNWPAGAEIELVEGLVAPGNKQSNLYKALQGSTGEYVVGGHRWRGTEGWNMAVRI